MSFSVIALNTANFQLMILENASKNELTQVPGKHNIKHHIQHGTTYELEIKISAYPLGTKGWHQK